MKLNHLQTFLLLVATTFIAAQEMPIDFSDTADSFVAFDGSGFAFTTDPDDANNEVGQFFNDGTAAWQGFFLELTQPVELSFQQSLSLSFYAFDPNEHTILLKLENGDDADVEVVQTTASVGWTQDIIFDFANAVYSDSGTAVNALGTYNRITIFIDGGENTPGTYLIDTINDGSDPTNPHELDVIYTELVWSDEFDTNGPIDATKWFHQTQLPEGGNWFNGEEQHYTDRLENSFVEDGYLNIVAIKESFTDQGETKEYTSARLNSKFAFTYGRIDVRAKLPFGEGTWPAIWTLGKNIIEAGAYWDTQGFGAVSWPVCGEIDIMEHGLGALNHVSCALHTSCDGCSGNTMNTETFILNDVANEFHEYSVNWSPNQITFLIDGVGYYTYNPPEKDITTWPFFEDQYMLLNIAMGGFAGTIDPNFTQSNMIIDYVRVYQNPLSIAENSLDLIKIYPNPASDIVHISTQATIDTIVLYNMLGQVIIKANNAVEKKLNITGVLPGMYVLKVYSGNAYISKKILIN